jgi:hypothetical protein
MWRLYEISDLMRQTVEAVLAKAAEAEGEVSEDWSEFLDDVRMERDAKALDIGRYVKNLTAEAEAVKAEKQKLATRQTALENRVESLKNYLTCHLQAGEKISDANTVLSWRKSSAVHVFNADMVPDMYCVIERTPRKPEIKEAIKAGAAIPGAEIVEKQSIQIK